MRRIARLVAGFALLSLGIAGLILPVLHGWAFVIAGLLLLGREYHWARRMLEWLRFQRKRWLRQ